VAVGPRSAENQARNKYRHPLGTLTFLGLEDGMTVLEITPGAGWYSEILAPVMRGHGKYIVAIPDDNVPGQPEYRYGLNKELRAKFAANPGLYDEVAVVPFSPPQVASLGEPDSIDLVLTFRNTHGWIPMVLPRKCLQNCPRIETGRHTGPGAAPRSQWYGPQGHGRAWVCFRRGGNFDGAGCRLVPGSAIGSKRKSTGPQRLPGWSVDLAARSWSMQ
jgi:hypothetical protein